MIAELPISAHFRQIKDALYGLKCSDKAALMKRNKALESMNVIEQHVASMKLALEKYAQPKTIVPCGVAQRCLDEFRVAGGQADD